MTSDGLRIDIATIAAIFRGIPDDWLEAAICFFEAGMRDPRGPASLASLRALELMREGVDPEDTLRVFDNAVRLAGTPAASRMPIERRLAALPREENVNG